MKLVLGAAQFGMDYGVVNNSGTCTSEELKKIVDCALEFGITEIDTAVIYGDSEKNLGMAGIEEFKVSSKIPYLKNYEIGDLGRYVSNSLKKLHIPSLETLYLHDERNVNNLELVAELNNLKDLGKIQKTGVSIYAKYSAKKNISKLESFDIVQCQGNAFDDNYQAYKSSRNSLYLRSIFLQGLLLCNLESLPLIFNKEKSLFLAWEKYCKFYEMSKLEMSLYNVSKSSANAFVIGVSSLKDLEEIITARENAMKASEIPFFAYDKIQDWVIDPRGWNL
jgi:aryl-alcohol dehydrogenase-like predicted oxidoreductase